MILTCDRCGKSFERPRSIAMRRNRKHHYCSTRCSQVAAHRPKVKWLNAADADDERFLVGRIVQTAADMQKYRFGSLEWERLDAQHTALLDVTAVIFSMRGKHSVMNERP